MGNARVTPSRAIGFAALCGLAIVFVLPFLWMLGTSLTPAAEVIKIGRPFFPRHPDWENYREALTVMPFGLH